MIHESVMYHLKPQRLTIYPPVFQGKDMIYIPLYQIVLQ